MATIGSLVARGVRDPETGCLRWTGAHAGRGRGQVDHEGKPWGVHRLIYTLHHGEIPEGMEIDHVHSRGCRYVDCFEIEHLEAVTPQENMRRRFAVITHCPHGHEYTEANTMWMERDGYPNRRCRTCHAERQKGRKRGTKTCEVCGETRDASNFSRHMRKHLSLGVSDRG